MDDFQARSTRDGREFEQIVARCLQAEGWFIKDRRVKVGALEVDLIGVDPEGQEWWIECKGSWEGSRPGLRREDTTKKAIANAWFLAREVDALPFMLVSSHEPAEGSLSARMLRTAINDGLVSEIRVVGLEVWP
jgi:Holliday junction resolvase-like predicted endonuclease